MYWDLNLDFLMGEHPGLSIAGEPNLSGVVAVTSQGLANDIFPEERLIRKSLTGLMFIRGY